MDITRFDLSSDGIRDRPDGHSSDGIGDRSDSSPSTRQFYGDRSDLGTWTVIVGQYWGQVRLGSDDFGTLLQPAYSNVGRSSGLGPFDQCLRAAQYLII